MLTVARPAAPPPTPPMAAAVATPTAHFSALLAQAEALKPLLRERAPQTERERRVSVEVTDRLRAAGLYRAVQPRRFGGLELSMEELRQLSYTLGQGCTSTGWCFGLSAAAAWMLGMFPSEAQHDVWDSASDAVLASCIAPTGRATRAADGSLRLKGRWGFGSNCDNAQWMSLGALIDEGDGQPPRAAFLLVPKGQYRIVDTWFTGGLAGTGSKDIAIDEEVTVPAHRSVLFSQVLDQDAPGALVNDNAGLYRLPLLSAFPPLISTPTLAALRGALDDFVAGAAARATRGAFVGGGSTIAQFGHVQTAVAEGEAALDAAQLILQRDLQQVIDLASAGVKVSAEQRIAYRRGHAYAVRLCVQAIDSLYDVVGGAGIQMDNAVQRAWRDIHAVAHHISTNWHAVSTMVGQQALGLPPKGQY